MSLYNSAFYTVFAVPIQLVISFTLALALTQKIKFRDVYRSGFYMPIIIPLVAWSVVWQRVLHPEFGILNEVLGWLGIAPQPMVVRPTSRKTGIYFYVFLDDRPPDGDFYRRPGEYPGFPVGGGQY